MQEIRPSRGFTRLGWSAALLCAALGMPRDASATLGEPEASVQADSVRLQGSLKASNRDSYRVHEIQLPSGTLVREYSVPDGTVFAVAWSGPFMPNLRQMLGRYFDEYAAAAAAAHGDHRHLEVRRGDFVVQVGGHMRAFAGRAYLPAAVPGGVSIGELQ